MLNHARPLHCFSSALLLLIVSLARAADLEKAVVVKDIRFDGEPRFRLYGRIDGAPYCLAAVMREGRVRAISLRRAHAKEFNRHVR